MLAEPSEIHRFSIEEYHQLIESGGMSEGTPVEMIDGFIVDRTPRGPVHEHAVSALIGWLRTLGDRFEFGVRSPLTLGYSEP